MNPSTKQRDSPLRRKHRSRPDWPLCCSAGLKSDQVNPDSDQEENHHVAYE